MTGVSIRSMPAPADLYEILEERYGHRSTILTSQVSVDKWHEVIGDPPTPTPSSIASSTTPIASISPATACVGPDQKPPQRIDPHSASRHKTNRQQDAPQAGDIMSEQRAT